jgi:hypothetical protein
MGRPSDARGWRLIWLGVVLQLGGLAFDTAVHDGDDGAHTAGEMLWAHGLIYAGAFAALLGGREAATRASGSASRWTATLVAVTATVQALSLGLDFVGEVAGASFGLELLAYVLALAATLVAATTGTVLRRRADA